MGLAKHNSDVFLIDFPNLDIWIGLNFNSVLRKENLFFNYSEITGAWTN